MFKTKPEAKDWAARQSTILSGGETAPTKRTLADLLRRYAGRFVEKTRARWGPLVNKFAKVEVISAI